MSFSDQAFGPDVTSAPIQELIEAIGRQSTDMPWSSVSGSVLPLIPRLRPYPAGIPAAVTVMAPPGIAVGFGIDFGPGFMNVNAELLAMWSVSTSDVMSAAVRNVHERAARINASEIHHDGREGVVTEWLQTNRSVGSTLVLAPTELTRLFGQAPRRFITPMRDLIIGFPPDADPELVCWYFAEVASQDPNCLGPMSYLFVDGQVVPEPLDRLLDGNALPLS